MFDKNWLINKNWLMLGAGGVIMVVAGAVAVAATDWGGGNPARAASATSPTFSASPRAPRNGRHSSRGSATLALIQYDANNDGRITRAEVEAGIAAQFKAIDTNHDGRIDATEYQVYDAARRAERKARRAEWLARSGSSDEEQPAVDRVPFDSMKRLDWNLDGFVTPDEFGGRMRSLAMRADRDGDGTILVEELKNPPPSARGRRRSTS